MHFGNDGRVAIKELVATVPTTYIVYMSSLYGICLGRWSMCKLTRKACVTDFVYFEKSNPVFLISPAGRLRVSVWSLCKYRVDILRFLQQGYMHLVLANCITHTF